MIKRIDIPDFGCFSDFEWSEYVCEGGVVVDFGRLNILYGRNYSGKTTLSRIMRSLEEHSLPGHFEGCRFVIETDEGRLDETSLASHNLDIRVYNRDFVADHLSFLTDEEGHITPFAVVGSENKAIEAKLDAIAAELGTRDEGTGKRHEYSLLREIAESKRKAADSADESLKAKLTGKATRPPDGIKHNPIYRDPNYNTPKIEADILTIRRASVPLMDAGSRAIKFSLLEETPLPDISTRLNFGPTLGKLHADAATLLARRIAPTQPLQDLLDDAVLQAWVKSGIPLHREKRKACAFCGRELPPDLWEKLDAHFNRESEELDAEIGLLMTRVESEKTAASAIDSLSRESFYAANHMRLAKLRGVLAAEVEQYISELERIRDALQAQRNDIFTAHEPVKLIDNSDAVLAAIDDANELIEANNTKTQSLAADQELARTDLRLSEIAQFVLDIGLEAEEVKVAQLSVEAADAERVAEASAVDIAALQSEAESLRVQLRDEKRGAERVNSYLSHFFGHDGLRLSAVEEEDGSAYKFEILRGKEPAHNLSEGECSLVAFCYFVAKLQDADSAGRDLIIYIDDPVSSLDTNHIYFMFSLIESELARPTRGADGTNTCRYEQLFVSTHNLDFLKYLKRLSRPSNVQGGVKHFLLEQRDGRSWLGPMPKHLRDYSTEFNYLFGQIYQCRDPENSKADYDCFYNFGNNLRKFLEAYLFYRYPFRDDQEAKDERLKRFFGGDLTSTALATLLTNDLSHLDEAFDRGMRPLEIPEISALANYVLDALYGHDADQFNALLESIGEPSRQPAA